MSYLLVQILVCLLIAGVIGGVIGWLLGSGCKSKLIDNDEYWESEMKNRTLAWDTKVQGLMLDKKNYIENSKNELLSTQQKVSLFEKQNKELTLKNSNLLLNEQKLMNEAQEKLAIQNSTWETKVNTLWSSKENLKSKALTLMTSYENLKLKFLESHKSLEAKNEVHEKLQGDFVLFQRKFEDDKNELDKKFTMERLAFEEKEDALNIQINNLKNEKKD